MNPVDVALRERTAGGVAVALDWINEGHQISERDAAGIATMLLRERDPAWWNWEAVERKIRAMATGASAPIYRVMMGAAAEGRLIFRVPRYIAENEPRRLADTDPAILISGRAAKGGRLSGALRIWPDPCPLPCIGEIPDDLGEEDREFIGTGPLAPAEGSVFVPEAHAVRAWVEMAGLDLGVPLDGLPMAIGDRIAVDGGYPFGWMGRIEDGRAIWDGVATEGRRATLELEPDQDGEHRLTWNSGTGEPSGWIGRALALAGILGDADHPDVPGFGTLAEVLYR